MLKKIIKIKYIEIKYTGKEAIYKKGSAECRDCADSNVRTNILRFMWKNQC